MPPQYLEGNAQDAYAIQRAGSTFSDALLGLAQMRRQQQQFQAQQAMEQMYLQLAREKQGLAKRQTEQQMDQERTLLPASLAHLQAQTGQANATAGSQNANAALSKMQLDAGRDLGFNLKQYSDLQPNAAMHPELLQAVQGYIAKNQGELASSSPQNIAKQTFQIQGGVDPMVRNMIALDQPMIEKEPFGGRLFDVQKNQPIDTNTKTVGNESDSKAEAEFQRIAATVYDAASRQDALDSPVAQAAAAVLQKGFGKYAGSAPSSEQPKPKTPQAGEVIDGYRFKGGNPAQKSNWEKVK